MVNSRSVSCALPISPSDLWIGTLHARTAAVGRPPRAAARRERCRARRSAAVPGAAERSGAALIQYGMIRQRSGQAGMHGHVLTSR
jgi:hypothetical protein